MKEDESIADNNRAGKALPDALLPHLAGTCCRPRSGQRPSVDAVSRRSEKLRPIGCRHRRAAGQDDRDECSSHHRHGWKRYHGILRSGFKGSKVLRFNGSGFRSRFIMRNRLHSTEVKRLVFQLFVIVQLAFPVGCSDTDGASPGRLQSRGRGFSGRSNRRVGRGLRHPGEARPRPGARALAARDRALLRRALRRLPSSIRIPSHGQSERRGERCMAFPVRGKGRVTAKGEGCAAPSWARLARADDPDLSDVQRLADSRTGAGCCRDTAHVTVLRAPLRGLI